MHLAGQALGSRPIGRQAGKLPSECWAAGSVGPSQARGFGGRLFSGGGSDAGARQLGGNAPRVVLLLLLLLRPPPSRSLLAVCLSL